MSTSGPVTVGVIGAGVISSQYLDNLTRFPDLEIRFIADLDESRAREQASRYEIPRSGTVDELLADSEIELVVNLTVPSVHVEVARRVLAAGKHVFTEKPFSLDRDSGLELLSEARRLGMRVACAPDTFLGAGLQAGKLAIDEGLIGEPLSAITLFQTAGPESWHPNPDFLYAPGAGPLFDMGPYYVTALVQNLGPVQRVSALESTARQKRVIASGPRAGESIDVLVPTHVSALLQFERGAIAQCVFSFQSSLVRRGFVEIAGSTGTMVFPDPNTFDGELTVWRDNNPVPEVIQANGASSSRGTGVLELARAIRAGRPERANGEQAYHVVDVLISITEASKSGQWVDVLSSATPSEPLPADWDPLARSL